MYDERETVMHLASLGCIKPSGMAKYLTGGSILDALEVPDQGFSPIGELWYKETDDGVFISNERTGFLGDKMWFRGKWDLYEAATIFKNDKDINYKK